jgi:hypothetical protein
MSKQDIVDGWSQDGQTYILAGMGYRLKKDLTQVCIGPVAADGEPLAAATTPPAPLENGTRAVTTMPQVELVGESVVTDKIKALAGQGKSSRDIEKELAADGIFISYRTVARRLQGVMVI